MKKTDKPQEFRHQVGPGMYLVSDTPTVPGWARVLADYLAGYKPTPVMTPRVLLRSSIDIINDLNNLADLEISDVASFMSGLGYHVDYSSGVGGWMLLPIDTDEAPAI